MGLSFLAPLFLAGLAAIAIPIIVHLTHRTKKDAVPFPSLMFVSQVPFRTVRRQRIHHWFLFLLRTAAIVLLGLAFARPWFDRDTGTAGALAGARELVVLVDRSYSMEYGDRWSRAITAAQSAIDGLAAEDRGSVVFFADRAEAVSQPTQDVATLRAAIDRMTVSAAGTRFGPALQLADQILEESDRPRREVVLISDFQRVGWDEDDDASLPEGTAVRPIDVGDPVTSNVAITSVTLERVFRSGRERVEAIVRLANQSEDVRRNLGITLSVDGQAVATQSIDVPANDAVSLRFPPAALPQRAVRAMVRIDDDALSVDNAFHFVLSPSQAISVLALRSPNAAATDNLYVTRALQIGSEPPFRTLEKPASQFRTSDLNGRDVVIYNDASPPRGARAEAVRQFVADGGGLLIVLGQRAGPGAWTQETADLLPGRVGSPVDRLTDRGATLNITDYDHPVFELFSAPRSGDYSKARFFRYRRLELNDSARVLARFDDGAVALAERTVGDGIVVVVTSDFTNSWNDLPLQPVFLPFLHQSVKHLARWVPQPASYSAGQVLDKGQLADVLDLDLDAGTGDGDLEVVVQSPSGGRSVLDLLSDEAQFVELAERGFYELRPVDDTEGETAAVAVNPTFAESDLTPMDPEELAGAITSKDAGGAAARLAALLTPSEKERRQGLWWYMLVGALLLLLADTAISNRITATRRSRR